MESDQPADARAQWRAERTTFQRVYDVSTGMTEYASAKAVSQRADCSVDGARAALEQLAEMGIVERRDGRPTTYRRNESYLRWKRVESLAQEHSVSDLRAELESLLTEDESFQTQFGVPDPDAVSPKSFDIADHDALHDRWDALTRWRTVREDLAVLQEALHRASGDSNGQTGTSASV
ncbi:DUF7342 family protein [Haloferax marisrubri]|uniref:Sugar-specific transcriptional regulator TrmB n=1 Tax=Haloferax marisrubri TaxID=1544719 RepID=A0A2P4NQX3_9EURY|nr:hypothetical protein [Haloferax marisrubri]POG55556.1 hypothetical protein AUR65_009130 [Haloferax marisrubri]